MNNLLQNAIKRTKDVAADYWKLVLEQRLHNSEKRAGSFFTEYNSIDELEKAILEANWIVSEGSVEEGKVVLCTTDFKGKDGVMPLSEVKGQVTHINPKNIEGRSEYAFYVEKDEELPDTNKTWLIISTYNRDLDRVVIDEPFIPTLFPGIYIGPDDTVVGKGQYAKVLKK